MQAQALDIVHEMPGGVLFERGMRRGAAASALIEQDDAIGARVVKAAHHRIDAAAGTAHLLAIGLFGRGWPALHETYSNAGDQCEGATDEAGKGRAETCL